MADSGPLLGRGRKSSTKIGSGQLELTQAIAGEPDWAILAGLDLERDRDRNDLAELSLLAESAGLRVVSTITGKRPRPDPSTFLGSGKLEELASLIQATRAGLVILNHDITPGQERNLERALKCRVIDRTGLILDIFAQRARSHEGKLQVELAQLERLATRLVRGWTHLERQKGGIGLRGPGETQLETDRRLLENRVKLLKERLRQVRRQHHTQRRARERSGILRVSLVGYTNAGKSTLFNRLAQAHTFAANQLFATLDTTTRRIHLADQRYALLSDTVGFIRHLPHGLVAAFRATLEEVREADLLLHVVDGADPHREEQIESVNQVLEEIGALTIPQILVRNKCDLMPPLGPGVERDACGRISAIRLSALTGEGVDLIRMALAEFSPDSLTVSASGYADNLHGEYT
jgi:GTP-binding protein HflX